MTSTLSTPSPLLAGEGLPAFDAITPEAVDRHMPELMAQLEAELSRVESDLTAAIASDQPLSWERVMEPAHRLGERLRWSWGVVSHLNGVCNSPELRQAHSNQQAAVVAFGNRAGQSQPLYQALRRLERQGGLDGTPATHPGRGAAGHGTARCGFGRGGPGGLQRRQPGAG